jgi:hypothetical protein
MEAGRGKTEDAKRENAERGDGDTLNTERGKATCQAEKASGLEIVVARNESNAIVWPWLRATRRGAGGSTVKNMADGHRERRWERRQARLHRERERAATDMANMARMMDKGRAVADALVWGALEMMAGEKRSMHNKKSGE